VILAALNHARTASTGLKCLLCGTAIFGPAKLGGRLRTVNVREVLNALPFRVLCDIFGPGRAFVPSHVQLMLVGRETDRQGM
jgi:hypothetical protein